jgi:hypothetical protein
MAPTTQAERTEAGTQAPTREQLWVRYLRLNAAALDAMADAYEAERVAAENDPGMTPEWRAARLAHLDEMIASYRGMAESAGRNADDEETLGCVCGGTGRLADHPCARCQPDLSREESEELAKAVCGYEVVSHG